MMKQYYYLDGQQQFGPLSKEELQGKNITKETLVWYEGLSEWTKAGELEDLADLFPNIPTPPPIPEQKIATSPPIPEVETTTSTPISNPKGKKIKKIILICLGLFMLIGFLFSFLFFQDRLSSERKFPTQCLYMVGEEVDDVTWSTIKLSGTIKNSARFTRYFDIKLHAVFYDKEKNIIKYDDYLIPGTCYSHDQLKFEVTIDMPKKMKHKINFDSWDIYVIEATPNNDF